MQLLRLSGRQVIFIKERNAALFELLWLPEDVSLEEAYALAEHEEVYGVAFKRKMGLLALRLQDARVLSNFAGNKGYDATGLLTRHKITGLPVALGYHGIY